MEDKDNIREKEFYREEIMDIVCSITRVDLLVYIHRLLSNIVKAGK